MEKPSQWRTRHSGEPVTEENPSQRRTHHSGEPATAENPQQRRTCHSGEPVIAENPSQQRTRHSGEPVTVENPSQWRSMAAGAISSCSSSLLWQIRKHRGGGEEYGMVCNSQRPDPSDPFQKATPPTSKISLLPQTPSQVLNQMFT